MAIEEYDPNKQTFSGMGPGVGGALGVTNDMNQGMMPQLQSIIDKVTGSFSGVSRGRLLASATSLGEKAMGIMGGLKQEEMQQAGAFEKTKLGEAGALERANIGIKPAMEELTRTPFKGMRMKLGMGDTANKPLSTLDDIMKKYMGEA